jgi:hypothetical protein
VEHCVVASRIQQHPAGTFSGGRVCVAAVEQSVVASRIQQHDSEASPPAPAEGPCAVAIVEQSVVASRIQQQLSAALPAAGEDDRVVEHWVVASRIQQQSAVAFGGRKAAPPRLPPPIPPWRKLDPELFAMMTSSVHCHRPKTGLPRELRGQTD